MALIGYTITVVAKQDNPYNVLPETDISIRKNSDNTLVNIYADEAGLVPIAQLGAKTDSNGQFTFYADASLGVLKAVWTNGGVIATEVLDQNDHSKLANRNAFGAHDLQSISGLTEPSDLDGVYRRIATVSEIEAGTFKAGDKLEVSDRCNATFNVKPTGSFIVNGFNVLNAGDDIVAVLNINSNTTSEHFGMAWDDITDDADAYESASNTMATLGLTLNHPDKTAFIGRNVTITGKIRQHGKGGWTPYSVGTKLRHEGFTINCIGNEPQFESVVFIGESELSGNSVYVTTSDPENDQNVDAKFIKCMFFLSYNPVHVLGRGVNFEQCHFSLFRRALRVEWPSPFNAPALLEQSLEFGMRGYNFYDCRWHAASTSGYILQNTGYNKDNLRGVTITGYPDTELSIIDGSMQDFEVDVNLLYGTAPVIRIGETHKVLNGVVKGVYSGVRDPSNKDTGIANMLAMTSTATIDNVVFDCVARDIKGSAFSLNGTIGDIEIKGNYSAICKQNDPSVLGTQRSFITKLGGTVTGKVKLSGNVSVPNYAANPTYLVNGLTDLEFEQGSVTIPSYTKLFGGNVRGRSGTVSRHTYTGNGAANRAIALPAIAQCVMVFGANPAANQGNAGVAFETTFGGTGAATMSDNKTLVVTSGFNTNGSVYHYIVVY